MNALRLLFLLLAIAVFGLLGWRAAAMRSDVVAVRRLPSVASPQTAPGPVLADVPEFASFYGRLKSEFPSDYASLADQITAKPGLATGNAAIWEALRTLEQSQGILAAEAGPAALDGYFDARRAVLDSLAPLNPHDCVDFLYGVPNASIADFTDAHRGLVATLADRALALIADGRTRHLDRSSPAPADRSLPTPADLDALSAALTARQVSAPEIGLLIDGTTPDPPLPDARLCDLGRIYLDVLRGLPPDMRQRIYGLAAELLARS